MKNFTKLFGIIASVAIIGLSMTACDDGSGSGSIDNKVVTADGWAWVSDGGGNGFVFRSNGTYSYVYADDGVWVISYSGNWDIKDGSLYQDGDGTAYSISADGNTLNWAGSTYTKTQVGTITQIE